MNDFIIGRKRKGCFFLDMPITNSVLPIHLSFYFVYHVRCSLHRQTVEHWFWLFFGNSLDPNFNIFEYASDGFHADINIFFCIFVLERNFKNNSLTSDSVSNVINFGILNYFALEIVLFYRN